jgi:hypothetical protein
MLGFPEFDFIGYRGHLMATLYFFSDESGKYRKNPVVTVSGVAAQSGRLTKFNEEWTALLRSYGLEEFHMSRAADLTQACGSRMPAHQTIAERTQLLYPFADCINDHMEIGLMQGWDVKGYNNLSLEVKCNLGGSPDPYHLALVRALLQLDDYVRADDSLSVICDDDELTAWDAYCHYRAISKAEPGLNKKLAGITFAKSHFFTPLQAADMVAFLTRKEATKEFWGKANDFEELLNYLLDGGQSNAARIIQWYHSYVDEQGFVNLANNLMREKLVKGNGVSEVRQHDATAYSGATQRDQSGAGRGKSGQEK